ITTGNILPMMAAGLDNLSLVKYLIGQLLLSEDERVKQLREYFPNAKGEDWSLAVAGQRVQIVKKDPDKVGILQFGTEVVTSADGTIAALLGASPGASTAAPIMLKVLEKAFADKLKTPEWQSKMKEIIPSYGQKLNNNPELQNRIRAYSSNLLQLQYEKVALTNVTAPPRASPNSNANEKLPDPDLKKTRSSTTN
ncbi:MAG: hypothetical protein EOP50_19715, partial [Sphingobacteriales bacterium]